MNQHYKKLGFTTPKNYFQKSNDQILSTTINHGTNKFEHQSRSTLQLLIAAVFHNIYTVFKFFKFKY